VFRPFPQGNTRRWRWVAAVLFAIGTASRAAPAQKVPQRFRDPEDGRMDVSDWLLNQKGFLPIPILITEPALGLGAGLFVAFFSRSIAEGAQPEGTFVPPAIYGGGGFYTSGGSAGGAGFAFLPFRRDHFRYVGALGSVALELDFFGFDPEGPLQDDPIAYRIDPSFTFHRLQGRIPGTNLFAGVQYTYVSVTSEFEEPPPSVIDPPELDEKVGGFGAGLEFDSRDNLLDAKRGMDVSAFTTWYGPTLGGDEAFTLTDIQGLFYGQPSTRWGYGVRVDAGLSSGDPPFFMKPWLSMRGLPATRYVNNVSLLGEAELRYSLDSRWTVLAFGGGGRVADTWSELDGASGVAAGGAGFRYLIARQLGIGSGLDFAFGPGGEFAFYIQMGSAWK
jgi:hypothetical protein